MDSWRGWFKGAYCRDDKVYNLLTYVGTYLIEVLGDVVCYQGCAEPAREVRSLQKGGFLFFRGFVGYWCGVLGEDGN